MGCGGGLGAVVGGAAGFLAGGPAGAAIGAGLGMSAGGAMDAANAQEDALQAQQEMSAQQQEMWAQQLAQWNRIYGPAERNLGYYYSMVTPDQVTSLGLQNVQQEFQAQMKQTQKTMAQRGMGDTTAENQIMAGQRVDLAQARANVRLTAPAQLRAEQMSFLATGKGAQTNTYNSMTNALSQQANALSQQANVAGQQSAALMQGVGSLAGAGMQYYAMNPNMFSSGGQLPSLGIGGNFTPITGGII